MDCEECAKSFWVDIEYSIDYTSWAYADEKEKDDSNAEQPDSAQQRTEENEDGKNIGQSDSEGRSADSVPPAQGESA